jgi:hypothetical protein
MRRTNNVAELKSRLNKKAKRALEQLRALNPFLPKNSPSFLVIGAQKSGTSSLHYLLSQHPSFSAGLGGKELRYFSVKCLYGKSYDWYKSKFRGPPDRIYFESTPEYLYYPGCCERIWDFSAGAMKIVVILRDPVERAFSAYNHYRVSFSHPGVHSKRRRRSRENSAHGVQGDMLYELLFSGRSAFPSFEECIDVELKLMKDGDGLPCPYEPSILRRGLYARQLEEYSARFGKNLLIIGFRDFVDSTEETLDKVVQFVGGENAGWSFLKKELKNAKPYSAPLLPKQRDFLEGFYREPNRIFRERYGDLNW